MFAELRSKIAGVIKIDEQKVADLVAAFYRRVRQDKLIGPMYPQDDWDGAEKRLRDFLVYRFGGSDLYIRERGHPRLGMRHMHFQIEAPERDRWLKLMDEAIEEVDVPKDAVFDIKTFFQQVANFLAQVQA